MNAQNQTINQPTPLINRLFFALIAALIIADPVAMIVYFAGGADTPPFFGIMLFAALPALGLILATFKGNIRLRLHPIWTPIGILALLITPYLMIISRDILTESVYFIFGFALLVAFVDLKILEDYAYYFTVLGLFCTLEMFPAGFFAIKMSLEGSESFEWGGWLDELLFLTGPMFLYYTFKKLKLDKPGWKKILKTIGIFIIAVILIMFLGKGIGSLFPKDSWLAHWFKLEKATQNVKCTGSLCGTDFYVEPYDKLYVSIPKGAMEKRSGNTDLAMVIQDHDLVGCDYLINTDAKNVTINCKKNIKGSNENNLIFEFAKDGQKQNNNNGSEESINNSL